MRKIITVERGIEKYLLVKDLGAVVLVNFDKPLPASSTLHDEIHVLIDFVCHRLPYGRKQF